MTRKFTLTDPVDFRLLFEAFRGRAPAKTDKGARDTRRSEAKILTALKAISDPVGDDLKPGELDFRLRTLKDGGGALTLEQVEFKLLQSYVEQAQWQAGASDVVSDLEDRLDAAEKEK